MLHVLHVASVLYCENCENESVVNIYLVQNCCDFGAVLC